jgi:hypothetical protein
MKEEGRSRIILGMFLSGVVAAVLISGCIGDGEIGDAGYYCCRYETRHTGCGGKDWSDWETAYYSFNIDDYKEDWTPQRVCGKYTRSDTQCGGGCCIYVEYRNNRLSGGSCS